MSVLQDSNGNVYPMTNGNITVVRYEDLLDRIAVLESALLPFARAGQAINRILNAPFQEGGNVPQIPLEQGDFVRAYETMKDKIEAKGGESNGV